MSVPSATNSYAASFPIAVGLCSETSPLSCFVWLARAAANAFRSDRSTGAREVPTTNRAAVGHPDPSDPIR